MPERHYLDLDGVSHFVIYSNIDCDNEIVLCQDSEKNRNEWAGWVRGKKYLKRIDVETFFYNICINL